jgi:DNA-binding transcriptional LysR family regulator
MRFVIRYVEALYKERSFSKAARSLYISQPALSTAIRKLEKELGVVLFDRSASSVTPTEACEFYIRGAKEIQAVESTMDTYFKSIQNLEAGTLKIGTSSFFCCYSLPIHLHPFSHKHPDLKIRLEEYTSNRGLAQALSDGTLDLVLTSNANGFDEFEKTLFQKETLILAVPSSWTVNRKLARYAYTAKDILDGKHLEPDSPAVSLRNFRELPYISLKPESDLYGRAIRMFHKENCEPEFQMYTDQMPTSYYMAYYGYGFAIIRDTTLRIVPVDGSQANPRLVFYRINNPQSIRDVNFYYRDLLYQAPAVKAFLEYTETKQRSGR